MTEENLQWEVLEEEEDSIVGQTLPLNLSLLQWLIDIVSNVRAM